MDFETHEQLKQLKYEYIHALDQANKERFISVFTTDAVFAASSYGEVKGHDGLREFIEYRSNDKREYYHMATNPSLSVDGDTANGKWYYIIMKIAEDGTAEWGQGRYEDTYRKVGGEWKIQSLRAERNYTIEVPPSL